MSDARRLIPTWRFVRRVIRYAPGVFVLQSVAQIFYLGVRVLPGLLEKAIFDTITGAVPAGIGRHLNAFAPVGMVISVVAMLIALYVSVGLARMVAAYGESWAGYTFRLVVGARLRYNLMAARLRQPAAVTPPMPAGEVINRYRTDVDEVSDFPLWLPDVAGNVLSFVVAVAIMVSINWAITLFIFLPIMVDFVVSRMAWTRYLAFGHAAGKAEDKVTGYLGETFASVLAVKVAGAEASVTAHFASLSRSRNESVVRLQMLDSMLGAIYQTVVTVGIGIMLLLAGQAMLNGSFTVGDFALFTYYIWFATDLPGYLGTFVGDIKQQEVAIERLVELIPDEDPSALIAPAPVQKIEQAREPSVTISASCPQLAELQIRNLTSLFPSTSQGIRNVNLTLAGGSFTVITGQIGAGKTTLLRVLLGLLPRQTGEIRWNEEEIADPEAWFRPPCCAYTPQTPRLFSTTLRDNILLGLKPNNDQLQHAIWQAVLDPDIAQLARGLETVVGPRGVRLSGGQVQRSAAARMLVRTPQLLVCDDLSSALDVETERLLWERVRLQTGGDQPPTLLVVSHRRPVLRQAQQVVIMEQGQIAGVGTLDTLLRDSAEMRRLWAEEPHGGAL
jgi:ATP-binding cassette subfamily B protein